MTQLSLIINRSYHDGMSVKNIKFHIKADQDMTENFNNQINKVISQVEAGDFEDVIYED